METDQTGAKLTTSSKDTSASQLVPILLGGGVLSRDQVEAGTKLAKELGMELHEALVDAGITEADKLETSIKALKLVEDKRITLDMAIRAVRLTIQNKVSLDDAIKSIEKLHQQTHIVVSATNELTQLLMSAKMLTRENLGTALKSSQDAGMMVGQWLLTDNQLTTRELYTALGAVLLMRETGLEKDKAAQGLRYAKKREVSFEQALFELGFFIHPDAKTTRVGELFEMAGLIGLEEMSECLEIELFKKKPFGQILVERGIVNRDQLESAETLQGSVAKGTLKPYQAAEALRRVLKEDKDVYASIAEYQLLHKADMNTRLGDLLVESEVCKREELEKAMAKTDSAVKIGKLLLDSKLLTEEVLYKTLRVQTLLRFGYVPRTKAVELLKHAVSKDVSLDDAFEALAVRVPPRMQWSWV
ncbi:MAG: hypothetical protein SGJ27_19790 [Candidatus Melainabacteria bacterium]|nr:hypothetical protein [Candidatus Melainabacteria bacterium]